MECIKECNHREQWEIDPAKLHKCLMGFYTNNEFDVLYRAGPKGAQKISNKLLR